MLIVRNFMVALFISAVLALLLSLFSGLSREQDVNMVPVFQQMRPIQADKHNLADIVSLMRTNAPISHVVWQNNNLFLEFQVDPAKPIYTDDVYEDLFNALQATFLNTRNVQGLYATFIYHEKGKEEVLIALSAERSRDLAAGLGSHLATEDKKAFLNKYTTLTYGVVWKEKVEK